MAAVLPTYPLLLNNVPVGSLWGGASGILGAAMPAPVAGAVCPNNIPHQANAITAGTLFEQAWNLYSFTDIPTGVNISNDLMLSGFYDLNRARFRIYFGKENVGIIL